MRFFVLGLSALTLAGCSSWPSDAFPTKMDLERTLFSSNSFGLREGCTAMVAEITDNAADRLIRTKKIGREIVMVAPDGWHNTPISGEFDPQTYYEGAFGGCGDNRHSPLGDLPGQLNRPGGFYKIINGGEGIAIINYRAKLAGYFYFG